MISSVSWLRSILFDFYEIVKDPVFCSPPHVVEELQDCVQKFLMYYTLLAQWALGAGRLLYNATPKVS